MYRFYIDGLGKRPHVSIGSHAMILGTMNLLERRFPGSEYVFISSNPEVESMYFRQSKLNITVHKRAGSRLRKTMQVRQVAGNVDAVIAVRGDAYVTHAPHIIGYKSVCLKHRGIPLLMFTASIGPFARGRRSWVAKRGLSLFDVVTVREPHTQRFVHELGVASASVYPDTAYAWPACTDERATEILREEGIPTDSPVVGLNISILLHHVFVERKLAMSYENAMCRLIDHLRRLAGLKVVLIPHQVYYVSPESELIHRLCR